MISVLALEQAERRRSRSRARACRRSGCGSPARRPRARHARQALEIQAVQQLLVDAALQLLIAGAACIRRGAAVRSIALTSS